MAVPAQFGIVTLGVSDLARSATFYESLGWERAASSNESIVWFRTTGSAVGLFPYEELAADANIEPTGSGFGGITLAVNVGSEDEVTEALAAAEAAGATIIKPAVRAEWGGFSGYFADPDGYPWEVAHNPHFPIVDGRVTIP